MFPGPPGPQAPRDGRTFKSPHQGRHPWLLAPLGPTQSCGTQDLLILTQVTPPPCAGPPQAPSACVCWATVPGWLGALPSSGEPTQHLAPHAPWPLLGYEVRPPRPPDPGRCPRGPASPPHALTAWKPCSSTSVLSSTTRGPFRAQWKASATSRPVPSGSDGPSSPKNRRSVASVGKG